LLASVLVTAMTAFLGLPVCYTAACPMSGADRAACRAMGRECCGTRGGQVSHTPALPASVLAAAAAAASLVVPAAAAAHAVFSSSMPLAAPAVLQGVGLFTLFAVFLI
jgi:hypothetical protein